MNDADGNEFVDDSEGLWGHLVCYHDCLFLAGNDERKREFHAEYHQKPCDHTIESLAYNAAKAEECLMEEIGGP